MPNRGRRCRVETSQVALVARHLTSRGGWLGDGQAMGGCYLSDATWGQEANIAHTTCVRFLFASKRMSVFERRSQQLVQVAIKIQNADEMAAVS